MPIEIIIPVIIFVSGVGFGLFMHSKKLKPLLELKRAGAIIDAQIVEKSSNTSGNSTRFHLKYSFHDHKGQLQEGETGVSQETYDEAEEGDTIQLKYLKNNPKFSRVPSGIDSQIKLIRMIVYILYFEAFIVAPLIYLVLDTVFKL